MMATCGCSLINVLIANLIMKENIAAQSKWNVTAQAKILVVEFFMTSDDTGCCEANARIITIC